MNRGGMCPPLPPNTREKLRLGAKTLPIPGPLRNTHAGIGWELLQVSDLAAIYSTSGKAASSGRWGAFHTRNKYPQAGSLPVLTWRKPLDKAARLIWPPVKQSVSKFYPTNPEARRLSSTASPAPRRYRRQWSPMATCRLTLAQLAALETRPPLAALVGLPASPGAYCRLSRPAGHHPAPGSDIGKAVAP
jgi:hypothetical protein